jgi:hypothetical protein
LSLLSPVADGSTSLSMVFVAMSYSHVSPPRVGLKR